MESGRIAAAQIVGERAAWAMVHDTPARITQQQFTES
jgi:hypothetical protein